MEKLVKQRNKNNLLAFLPKAASAVDFQVSSPLSPRSASGAAFTPVHVSLIPKGAPSKSRNGSFDVREPASPKVSCVGQIKCNKKITVGKLSKLASPLPQPQVKTTRNKKHLLMMIKVYFKGTKLGAHIHKPDEVSKPEPAVAETVLPSLGQMKQFSSARGVLSDFDWRACNAAAGDGDAGCISNPLYEEKEVKSGKEEEVVVVNEWSSWNIMEKKHRK